MRLTWDEDDIDRGRVTKRAMTKKDIDDNDFSAYIASGSESESESAAAPKHKTHQQPSRDALRALLLGGNEENLPEGWGDDGIDDKDVDMEVTFSSGLGGTRNPDEETTLEAYKRRMKERKKLRKDTAKEPVAPTADGKDEFFGEDGESSEEDEKETNEASRHAATAEELAHLVRGDASEGAPKHFDLKAVLKAEKTNTKLRKKKGKQRSTGHEDEIQEDFSLDVADNRFAALHEDPKFAIDPSNPQYVLLPTFSLLLLDC